MPLKRLFRRESPIFLWLAVAAFPLVLGGLAVAITGAILNGTQYVAPDSTFYVVSMCPTTVSSDLFVACNASERLTWEIPTTGLDLNYSAYQLQLLRPAKSGSLSFNLSLVVMFSNGSAVEALSEFYSLPPPPEYAEEDQNGTHAHAKTLPASKSYSAHFVQDGKQGTLVTKSRWSSNDFPALPVPLGTAVQVTLVGLRVESSREDLTALAFKLHARYPGDLPLKLIGVGILGAGIVLTCGPGAASQLM
jgi:hypothetical protein